MIKTLTMKPYSKSSITLYFAVACCISPFTHASDASATLLDIYELARKNDHQLKADRAEYLADKESAAIARSALLPQINLTASVNQTDTNISGVDTVSSTAGDRDTDDTSYTIELVQPIINFNAWNNYQQGKTESRRAEVTYQANQQALLIRTSETYFNALRAFDQLATAQAQEKAQATLLEQTRQRYEVGLISINDVYETQAAYDSAVANTINAQANLGIQYDNLTVLTGQQHSSVTPLQENFTASAPKPESKQAWVDFALKNNFQLKVSELNANAARFNAKAIRSNRLPVVDGRISHGNSDQETEINNNTSNLDTDTTQFSINLRVPLYAGGGLTAQQRQAEKTALQAQETFLLTQRSTIQNTRSLYLSVTTAIAQIKARKQAIVSNESALEANKAGYDAGTRDIVDVVNAQQNLFAAKRDYLNTLYDYIINTMQLKGAAGSLQVSDLEALNKNLVQ